MMTTLMVAIKTVRIKILKVTIVAIERRVVSSRDLSRTMVNKTRKRSKS